MQKCMPVASKRINIQRTYTIIIDFGEAYFREDDESNEDWDAILKGNWDVDAVRQVLVRIGWASRKHCDRVRDTPP